VEVLTDAELEAELVEDRARCVRDRAQENVRVDEGKVPDEDRGALTVSTRFSASTLHVVAGHEAPMDGRKAATNARPVHDVVVHERERVQHLERGGGGDDDLG